PEPVGRGPPPAVDRLLASIGLTRPNVSDNNRTLERAQTDVSRPWVRCGGDGAVHPSRRRMLLRCSACAWRVLRTSASPPREGDAARRELEVPDDPVQRPDLDAAHEVIERLEWADG